MKSLFLLKLVGITLILSLVFLMGCEVEQGEPDENGIPPYGQFIAKVDSASFTPFLTTVFADDTMEPRQIYFEHEQNRAIRDGKWKLVAQGHSGKWELYDMEKDRTEMHDLSASMPEKAKELEKLWEDWAVKAFVKPYPVSKKKKKK